MKHFLLFFSLALCALACQKTTEPHLPQGPQTSKRLVKTVRTVIENMWGIPETKQHETRYFYDALGRVDSIKNEREADKIIYDQQGNVLSRRHYNIYAPGTIQHIVYEYGGESQLVTAFRYENAEEPFQYFDYDGGGYVIKTWFPSAYILLITPDAHHNPAQVSSYAAGSTTPVEVAAFEYDDKINPHFAANLYRIFPNYHSPNNVTKYEIIEPNNSIDYVWLKKDFFYTYDAEGLPIKMTNNVNTEHVEFFYE